MSSQNVDGMENRADYGQSYTVMVPLGYIHLHVSKENNNRKRLTSEILDENGYEVLNSI